MHRIGHHTSASRSAHGHHAHSKHAHAHPRQAHVHSTQAQGHTHKKLGLALSAVRINQGVVVIPETVNGRKVSAAEMHQALAALRALPAADLAMVAAAGIQIHLYPLAGLEDGLLGATSIVQESGGHWKPTLIRAAVRAGLTGSQSIAEIVQHEFGHAISVLRNQDRSEAAAIKYASSH